MCVCVFFSPRGTLRVWRGKGRWKIIFYFVHLYQLFPVKEEDRKTMRKCFCGREKQKLFFLCMPKTSKERVLISSSTLICYVWVFVCVWTSGFPHLPPWGRCFAYAVCLFLCILHEHTRANPGVLVSPVCMLMSDGLMGASQCVEWQLTYSAIQRGS